MPFFRSFRFDLVAILLLGMTCGFAHAQDKDPEIDDSLTIRKDVSIVNIFFNVKDRRGSIVPNLTKEDFQISEDGKPQTIKYFSAESNQPLTLGLLIDSSPSQERVLGMEKEVGAAFVKDVLREKDEAFVISFDVTVDLLQDFTNDARRLKNAMDSARISGGMSGGGVPGIGQGPFPTAGVPRGTLLYDAIYLAAYDKLAKEVGRKAMIVLTDGQDQGSKETIKDAIEAAQKSDSIAYVLLIADRGFYGGGYFGDSEMKKLCQETGGRVIEVGDKIEKLREAFNQIATELRSQYSIGYTPSNEIADGAFRRVQISTKNGLKVQSRTGYYAPGKKTSGD